MRVVHLPKVRPSMAEKCRTILLRISGFLFFGEALLHFLNDGHQALAWLNPFLFGLGFYAIADKRGPKEPTEPRLNSGGMMIALSTLLLFYRLTRF